MTEPTPMHPAARALVTGLNKIETQLRFIRIVTAMARKDMPVVIQGIDDLGPERRRDFRDLCEQLIVLVDEHDEEAPGQEDMLVSRYVTDEEAADAGEVFAVGDVPAYDQEAPRDHDAGD